ncbi:hypothetical protein N7495_008183 [Penicillium taxi]|uniref:uncharacterized protein n=1 Tax=Penicillium taxi TaxID=168475 RepID=UPI002545B18F|nr:uncharacterized protein N7495_008183 [Penicillium taxi]KAJ5888142.1 hypothetical protein N7495_008183 [Penicillium taxi]
MSSFLVSIESLSRYPLVDNYSDETVNKRWQVLSSDKAHPGLRFLQHGSRFLQLIDQIFDYVSIAAFMDEGFLAVIGGRIGSSILRMKLTSDIVYSLLAGFLANLINNQMLLAVGVTHLPAWLEHRRLGSNLSATSKL